MTNKEKALVDVLTLFLVATTVPAGILALLTYLTSIFTASQVISGIGIIFLLGMTVGFGKMYYDVRLDQLNRLDALKGKK